MLVKILKWLKEKPCSVAGLPYTVGMEKLPHPRTLHDLQDMSPQKKRGKIWYCYKCKTYFFYVDGKIKEWYYGKDLEKYKGTDIFGPWRGESCQEMIIKEIIK